MSSAPAMTTTSYAILGLLAVKPWTTHELVQQVDRSLRRMWPRAQSKLYEEPKKLVAHGYARADRRLRRPPPPHPLHDHRQGSARARRLVAGTRGRAGPRVRAAAQDQLRRQRQQGRHRRQPRSHPRLGARAERGEPGDGPRLPRRPRRVSRSAPRSTSSPAGSSPTSTSPSPTGSSGPSRIVEDWPDDVRKRPFDVAAAEEGVAACRTHSGARSGGQRLHVEPLTRPILLVSWPWRFPLAARPETTVLPGALWAEAYAHSHPTEECP